MIVGLMLSCMTFAQSVEYVSLYLDNNLKDIFLSPSFL